MGRLVKAGLLPAKGRNQAIFYDRRPRRGLSCLQEKSHRADRGGDRFVAAIKSVDSKVLGRLWKNESLVLPPLYFNGSFEWLYALIQLHHANRPLDQTRC